MLYLQLEKEIKELTKQRNLAQSRVEDLLQMNENDQHSSNMVCKYCFTDCFTFFFLLFLLKYLIYSFYFFDLQLKCSNSSKPLEETTCDDECSVSGSENGENSVSSHLQQRKELAIGSEDETDVHYKELRCIEMDESCTNHASELFELPNNNNRMLPVSSDAPDSDHEVSPPSPINASGIRNYFIQGATEQKSLKLTRSRSCRANVMSDSFSSDPEMVGQCETTPPNGLEKDFPGRPEGFQRKNRKQPPVGYDTNDSKLSRNNSQSSNGTAFIELNSTSSAPGEEGIPSVDTFVAGLKEMAKLHQVWIIAIYIKLPFLFPLF